jgi:hypothetical protein
MELRVALNSWRIKGVATTPKKKAQNGDVETHGQKLLQNINPNGWK